MEKSSLNITSFWHHEKSPFCVLKIIIHEGMEAFWNHRILAIQNRTKTQNWDIWDKNCKKKSELWDIISECFWELYKKKNLNCERKRLRFSFFYSVAEISFHMRVSKCRHNFQSCVNFNCNTLFISIKPYVWCWTGKAVEAAEMGVFQKQVESVRPGHHHFKLEFIISVHQENSAGRQRHWILPKPQGSVSRSFPKKTVLIWT